MSSQEKLQESYEVLDQELPLNEIVLPTDFSEATGINSETGKFRSSKSWSITSPTIPVAPTTAIFIV